MQKLLLLLLFTWVTVQGQDLDSLYLKNKSVTYDQAINYYNKLDQQYPQAVLLEKGLTDVGKPLHVFVISKDKDFDPQSIKLKNKRVVLILNGIHAGEPDGIDACINLSDKLLRDSLKSTLLDHLVLVIVPVYNIDGVLNRGCCSRANQNGPEEYGFRGNARNLDLNRDFIKMGSRNTRSLIEIFQEWNPDVFIDTHVSDGADYQYTMTLIMTQLNKLNPILAAYCKKDLLPSLYGKMKLAKSEMVPYVESRKETPDEGIEAFLETPRFSTGYSTLFNSIGFVTETHMWKPFPERVKATELFLDVLFHQISKDYKQIGEIRKAAVDQVKNQTHFSLNWAIDTTKFDTILFKGFEAIHKPSKITGLTRLYYDREKPFEKPVKYFSTYNETDGVEKPKAYVIPQAWREIIERLSLNGVKMKTLKADSMIEVTSYYIKDYKSPAKPYEGHYLHSNIEIEKARQKIQYFKGDYLVIPDQASNRYIVETLEPKGVDSFFAWNFFDSVLQQKEWFSDYIFEEKAEEILNQNPELKKQLDEKRKSDPSFAGNQFQQLLFIYQNSPYFEKTFNRYPVARIE